MAKKLTKTAADELARIASERRVGSPGQVGDDFIDLGMMSEENGQYGVILPDDQWYSTKSLGRKFKQRPIQALGGKSFKVVTRQSPEDGQPHVYLVPN